MSTPNYKKATAANLSKEWNSLVGSNHAEEQDLSTENCGQLGLKAMFTELDHCLGPMEGFFSKPMRTFWQLNTMSDFMP